MRDARNCPAVHLHYAPISDIVSESVAERFLHQCVATLLQLAPTETRVRVGRYPSSRTMMLRAVFYPQSHYMVSHD